jgi:hypothetical protein
MTISATTGAITATDAYGLVGATEPQDYRLPITLYRNDTYWADGAGLWGGFSPESKVTATTDQDVTVVCTIPFQSNTGGTANFQQSITIDNASTHGSEYDLPIVIDEDNGRLVGLPNKTVPSIGQAAPAVVVAQFEISTDGTSAYATQTNVNGIVFVESQNPSSSIPTFEVSGIHDWTTSSLPSESFSLYDADMPCSAYLMKQLVSINANAVGFKTLTRVSFPLMGIGSSV